MSDKSANERTAEQAPHYDKGDKAEQHWDRMWKLYREAWFVGNITKYVERYRSKNGMDDLVKAQHYLQKLIELEKADAATKPLHIGSEPVTITIDTKKLNEELARIDAMKRPCIIEQDGHGFGHMENISGKDSDK